jgi:hypothetical protein
MYCDAGRIVLYEIKNVGEVKWTNQIASNK